MNSNDNTQPRTRWGRTSFAGGRFPAMGVAIPVGVLLGAASGFLASLAGAFEGVNALSVTVVFALVMSWGFVGFVWVLIVDRSTLQGAPSRPQESDESRWLDTAMSGAFLDTVTITGLAVAALAFTRATLNAMWALVLVLVMAFVSLTVRYLIAKRRG